LTYGRNKVHFRVKWSGKPGTPSEGQIGLVNLTPERPLWDFPLPHNIFDNFRVESIGDRRQSARVKCDVPVELHPQGSPTMWGKASDLSVGGCFVEMPIPLDKNSSFDIALWLSGSKLRLKGEVASSAPGFGIGVRFVNVSLPDRDFLARHIEMLKLQPQT
jgi:PilZ domain